MSQTPIETWSIILLPPWLITPHTIDVAASAFSGKVNAGFPKGNATNSESGALPDHDQRDVLVHVTGKRSRDAGCLTEPFHYLGNIAFPRIMGRRGCDMRDVAVERKCDGTMIERLPITLRPARAADAEFVYRVTEACIRRYAEATWGQWAEATARGDFTPATHSIIREQDDDVGCIEIIDEPDHIQLSKIYILPAYQNRGIGTALLRCMINRAHTAQKPLRLRVLAVNPARRLYERLGFAVTASTPERYYMELRASESRCRRPRDT